MDAPSWITAISAAVSAAATIALAIVAAITIRYNSRLVELTNREVYASLKVIDEMQQDRVLANQPFLVIEGGDSITNRDYANRQDLTVRNVGPGSAVNTHYLAYFVWEENTQPRVMYHGAGPFAVAPGQKAEPVVRGGLSQGENGVLAGVLAFSPGERVQAVVCEDLFGNRFRFVRGQGQPEVYRLRSDTETPPWATGW